MKPRQGGNEKMMQQRGENAPRGADEKGVNPASEGQKQGAKPARDEDDGGKARQRDRRENREGLDNSEPRQQRAAPAGKAEKCAEPSGNRSARVSTEQRTKIRSSLGGARIREAPAEIEIMPTRQSYRIVRIHDEIVIMDPVTFEIVDVVV